MRKYTQEELQEILNLHEMYLKDEPGGEKAILRGADLYELDLSYKDLRYIDFSFAILAHANLSHTNLSHSILRHTTLQYANLEKADLRSANFKYAFLKEADLNGAIIPPFQLCPEQGSFIAYKKLKNHVIAQLEITGERTSSLVGRKCRCSEAKVLAFFDLSGDFLDVNKTHDAHTGKLEYRLGATVRPDKYNDDIRIECTNGIHFFMTFDEAREY